MLSWCQDCKFFFPDVDKEGRAGHCCRYPPQYVGPSNRIESATKPWSFPIVLAVAGCGEFEAKGETNEYD